MSGRALTLALCLALLMSPLLGRAQSTDALVEDFIKVYTTFSYIATVKGYCDTAAPTTSAANTAALEKWRKANNSDQIESLTRKMVQRNPQIKTTLENIRAKMLEQVKKTAAGREATWCGQFPALLEAPNAQVGQQYKLQIAQLNALLDKDTNTNSTKPSSSVTASKPTGTLYTIAQLSGLISQVYEATKVYADKDQAVEAKLTSLGTIFVKGTASENRIMIFDQGKYRSKYNARCSFQESADAKAFANAQGREVVMAGRFKDFQSYFGVDLEDCELISNVSNLKRSSVSGDIGLKRKAVTAQEVMTKPGAGVKTSQIQGLYFYHKNNQRMDGFGNLYIDVDERSYLVLKDGSAYQYDWGFPPEDFDVAASKREEPEAWGRWNNDSYDGIGNSEFEKLLPSAKGLRFDNYYSITATGMGGSIRESGIRFTKDGRFKSDSTAMLAGFTQGGGMPNSGVTTGSTNVTTDGAGQTMVSTTPVSSSTEGTYSIDGYAMTLKRSDGSFLRSFFAIPSYTSQTNPKYVVYRGAFWFGSGK